jgi:histidinol-phosphate aminotransferase
VGKVIKLNTNENPYPCSPKVNEAIKQAVDRGLQRYPDPTAASFRHRAAEVLGVDPDWILCGNGSDDLLTILTRAFVPQGGLLRLPYPSYVLYKTLAQIQGAQAEECPFDTHWQPGEEYLAARPGLGLAYLPNPNSPTGTVVSPERLLEIAQQLPCPLVIDEAYVDFADTHCVELVKQSEKVIVTRTLSKSYALAGLRFGYLVAQPQIVAELAKVKDSYNCDALSIAGATAAIDDQIWLNGNRAKVIDTRERLTAGLTGLGFEVIPSQANFVWCTLAGHDHKTLYEALKAQGILVRYMNYARWQDGLRISVGTQEQIEALLAILQTLV